MLSPITTDMLINAVHLGARPPDEFPLFLRGKKVEPKLVQRREVMTQSGLGYILHARTDHEGKGKIAIYEVNGKHREKAAELDVRSLEDVDQKFNKLTELIGRETTITGPSSAISGRRVAEQPRLMPKVYEASSSASPSEEVERMRVQLRGIARFVPPVAAPVEEEEARQERSEAEREAQRQAVAPKGEPEMTPRLVRSKTGQMVWYPHPPRRR